MTRDDIGRLAQEAGIPIETDWAGRPCTLVIKDGGTYLRGIDDLERFAALVAAHEREKVAAWMLRRSYATGHGDTVEDLLEEIEQQIRESERLKCAEVAESYEPTCDVCPRGVAAAIRARGET